MCVFSIVLRLEIYFGDHFIFRNILVMRETDKKRARENARQVQMKQLAEKGVVLNGKIEFPEFWAKRKHMINAGLMELLQKTADAEPEVEDAYGKYKQGTFLFKACIVTVTRENGLWMLHIFSHAMPITLPIIQEARDKYIPDYCMMVQFYPSREERNTLQGIQLCEMPGSIQADDDEPEPENDQEVGDQPEDNDQAQEVKE